MSRTAQSDTIQETFLNALKAEAAVVETMSELAARISDRELREGLEALGRAGRNLFLVKGVGLINVHVRSEPPGWWNILKSVKEELDLLQKELRVNRYFVFLIGRKDQHIADGYIASDFDAAPFIKHPGIEATKFTMNEKQHLDSAERLLSVSKIAKVLLGSRKGS